MQDAAIVKEAARGRWTGLILQLAPQATDAIVRGKHGPCPRHGGKDGFRVFKDFEDTGGAICATCGSFSDGLALLQWLNDWDFAQTLHSVSEALGLDDSWHDETPVNADYIATLWKQAVPDTGRISEYLQTRGLSGVVPPSLRLHPSLAYYEDNQLIGNFPAILAPVQAPSGEVVAIQRIYLSNVGSGKAGVSHPKKMTRPVVDGATRGAAVRLGPVKDHYALNVTEGIETGIAVQESTNRTTIAAVSAYGVENIEPPPGIKTLYLWLDNDVNMVGQRAGARARRRLEAVGVMVESVIPSVPGTDWLDELTKKAT